ncbi:MAG: FHA domain-containing protein [Anaerolineae bacterium]
MTRDWLLLGLRFLAPLLMYSFLGLVVYRMWQARQRQPRPRACLRPLDSRAAVEPLPWHTSLGRDRRNTIVVNNEFVSARHATLNYTGGVWWLADAGSTNGTRVNGQPIHAPTPLHYGDVIGLGSAQYRLEREP